MITTEEPQIVRLWFWNSLCGFRSLSFTKQKREQHNARFGNVEWYEIKQQRSKGSDKPWMLSMRNILLFHGCSCSVLLMSRHHSWIFVRTGPMTNCRYMSKGLIYNIQEDEPLTRHESSHLHQVNYIKKKFTYFLLYITLSKGSPWRHTIFILTYIRVVVVFADIVRSLLIHESYESSDS